MKRVTQGGDISFNVADVRGLGDNYAFRFYTTDSCKYIVKVDGDAVDDIIRLEWDELKTLGDGVLCYYADNLEPDEEYSDATFNRTFGGTTQWYIVTSCSGGGISDEISELSDRLDAEIERSSGEDIQHSQLISANTQEIHNLGNRLYTDTYTKEEVDRKIAEAEMGGDLPESIVIDANYVHTDNNFTTAEKNKLDGIATGAEVNVQADWNVTDSSSDAYIQHKPTIPQNTSDLTNDSNFVVDANYVHTDNNYTTTEKNKLEGLSNYNDTALAARVTANESAIANTYTKAEVDEMVADVQTTLTFDDRPIAGSDNPVKSGGIKTAIDNVTPTISVNGKWVIGGVETDDYAQGPRGNTVLVNEDAVGIQSLIVNNVNDGGESDILSAEMGKVLRINLMKIYNALGVYAFPEGKPILNWGSTALRHDISVSGVTGVITISDIYVDGDSVNEMPTQILDGKSLSFKLNLPNDAYVFNGVSVTLDGFDITNNTGVWNETTGVVTIDNVTGAVVVVAEAVSYVTDGLVFNLDCRNGVTLDGNNVPIKWTDQINNIEFDLTDVTQDSDGSLRFNGTSSKGISSGSLTTSFTSATVEVIAALTQFPSSNGIRQPILSNKTSQSVACSARAVVLSQGQLMQMVAHATNGTPNTNTAFRYSDNNIVISATNADVYTYGNLINDPRHIKIDNITYDINDYGATLSSDLSIGYQRIASNGDEYFMAGTIKAIRIYSRKLNEQEIQRNYALDNKRFNLTD